MKVFVFLSEMINKNIIDSHGNVVGRLRDITMRGVSDEVYPRAIGLIIRRGKWKKEFAHINLDDVEELNDEFRLKIPVEDILFQKALEKYDFSLCYDILDKQVVDTNEQKVVRVNDIHLLRVDKQLYLAHVDVGLRALIRRLEWTPFIDGILKILFPQSPFLTQVDFIPWKNTQALTFGRYKNVLRLDVARKKLSQIPPIELAEIMEDLDMFEKLSLFKSLDIPVQRKVFADLATQEKLELIEQLDERESANLLENIPADEATDLLSVLSKEDALRLMRHMETKSSRKLRQLLGFAKDSAGGLMTTEYLTLKADAKVKDAVQLLKDSVNYPGNLIHIYIVDDHGRLLASTSLRKFINADPEMPLMETCYPKKIFVRTDDGVEEVALLLEKYKFSCVPVLGDDDILQGVITTDDVLEELIALAWSKYKEKLT